MSAAKTITMMKNTNNKYDDNEGGKTSNVIGEVCHLYHRSRCIHILSSTVIP